MVKVDVRKAFDSIAQDSLAVLVRDAVAKRGGLVWESRLWLEILEAKVIDIYIGKSLVSVPQSSEVRQGSPDSANQGPPRHGPAGITGAARPASVPLARGGLHGRHVLVA